MRSTEEPVEKTAQKSMRLESAHDEYNEKFVSGLVDKKELSCDGEEGGDMLKLPMPELEDLSQTPKTSGNNIQQPLESESAHQEQVWLSY